MRAVFFKLLFLWGCTIAIHSACATLQRWDLKSLSSAPKSAPGPSSLQEPGMRALFFEGVPWKGKPTRVFAWYGLPANAGNEKFPAMVLVHGGGGTAFADWVRRWNERGYAAIAIDTCGNIPSSDPAARTSASTSPSTRDEIGGGPPCWDASFDQLSWPVSDQWTYHAVIDIILANSLLRSFSEIDPHRIGITGISWGGYLTAIVASVDDRFRFAIPVYGCGFLGEDSSWLPNFKKMGEANAHQWLSLWDPSVYLPQAKIPFLWVDSTNDVHYPLESLKKSYLLARGHRTLSVHLRMVHSHEAGEAPKEIYAFADQMLKGGAPLAIIKCQQRRGQRIKVKYKATIPIVRAELLYTADNNQWKDRKWQVSEAEVDAHEHIISTLVPVEATAYFVNLIDSRGLIVSTEHQTL